MRRCGADPHRLPLRAGAAGGAQTGDPSAPGWRPWRPRRTHHSDEFGTLAEGFNDMARQTAVHVPKPGRPGAAETAQLEEERGRLECLYEVTTLVAKAATLDELAQGFYAKHARIARADGVALRWSDEANRRTWMLASQACRLPGRGRTVPAGRRLQLRCAVGLAAARHSDSRMQRPSCAIARRQIRDRGGQSDRLHERLGEVICSSTRASPF